MLMLSYQHGLGYVMTAACKTRSSIPRAVQGAAAGMNLSPRQRLARPLSQPAYFAQMFDDPGSLRATARQYRRCAFRTVDREVIHVFIAVAEQYDRKAAALETDQEDTFRAWDSIFRRQHYRTVTHPV